MSYPLNPLPYPVRMSTWNSWNSWNSLSIMLGFNGFIHCQKVKHGETLPIGTVGPVIPPWKHLSRSKKSASENLMCLRSQQNLRNRAKSNNLTITIITVIISIIPIIQYHHHHHHHHIVYIYNIIYHIILCITKLN